MHVAHAGTSEVAIFGRVLEPDQATLDAAAARAILDLDFPCRSRSITSSPNITLARRG
jgi:hypothetical protein